MACVEWQEEKAKIKIKEQKLQKVEEKGFSFIFYLKIVWVYDNGNFYKENYVTATNWGTSHERWHGHGNMGTGLISENSLAICCPAPTQERKIQVLQQCISYFV